MGPRALYVLLACSELALAARVITRPSEDVEARAKAGTSGMYCCCRQQACQKDYKGDDERTPAVYSPNENLCCILKTWSCGNIFAMSRFTIKAPNQGYCQQVQDVGFQLALPPPEPIKEEDLQVGTPEHTVHNYCEFGQKAQEQESGEDVEGNMRKQGIVGALVKELAQNSLDSMAKEIFSIYICVRWAPTSEFVDVAKGEIRTKQLDDKSAFVHYKDNTFMPLRCSKNLNVYGEKDAETQTHYEAFETEGKALAEWYRTEKQGAVAVRLRKLQSSKTKGAELEALATAFDLPTVQKAVAKCPPEVGPITLNVFEATAEQLLKDCSAARWWLGKLRDWQRAMPFPSFMSPDKEAAQAAKPSDTEQAVVCFGKRVASQMHRRENGGYLLTDQSMVGCHGFWEMEDTSKMVDRIVQLWRPPTCQLAAMELDLKIKIMDVIASMNAKLFDALPAMLIEEMSDVQDVDGKLLEASRGLMVLKGVWNSIVTAFKGLRGNYVRLGQLLGNTVVKWVVCPLKPITDPKRLEQLDKSLGTEDDLARHYAQVAYAQWTGKTNLLPGQECVPYVAAEGAPAMPRQVNQCILGVMQKDMPEPYKAEDFLCPVRPLLPAKQQLEVFQAKKDLCVLHMNPEQMVQANWFYRGRTPQRKQYNVTQNLPIAQLQAIKVLDYASRPDTDFGIWRTFVTVGLRCTEEEASVTPRWCEAPAVANVPSITTNLLTGAEMAGGAIGSVVDAGLVAGGVKEKVPPNKATTERLGEWLSGRFKSFEMWIRSSTDQLIGRASGRYERMHQKLFAEFEAAELVHSTSFQSRIGETGADSKGRPRFDRFAVVVPCTKFDPAREFKLKYAWSEKALSMAIKANEKFPGALKKSGAFRMELVGAGSFFMRNEQNAWMKYSTHIRASPVGEAMPLWIGTRDPYMLDLSGTFDTSADTKVKAEDLAGFAATFACGTRVEMHNLPLTTFTLAGDFARCVKEGAAKNEQLRKSAPGAPFLRDEVVIRVTFEPLPECYHEVDQSLVRNVNETKNPVFTNFMSLRGCVPPPSTLPQELAEAKRTSNYRGLLIGKGLPQETLLEVLLQPSDFLAEISL